MFALDHMIASLIAALHLSTLDTIIVYKGASTRFIAYHLSLLSVSMRIQNPFRPPTSLRALLQHKFSELLLEKCVGNS